MPEIIQFFDTGTGIAELNLITREWFVIIGGVEAYYARVRDLTAAGWSPKHIGRVDNPAARYWKQVPSPAPPPK